MLSSRPHRRGIRAHVGSVDLQHWAAMYGTSESRQASNARQRVEGEGHVKKDCESSSAPAAAAVQGAQCVCCREPIAGVAAYLTALRADYREATGRRIRPFSRCERTERINAAIQGWFADYARAEALGAAVSAAACDLTGYSEQPCRRARA